VDTPKEAARIKAHGGQLMSGGQRIISPSGRHSLNMARAFGDADYKTPNRIVSAVPDVRHVSLGCGCCGALILPALTLIMRLGRAVLRAIQLG
jgi:Protein phosphatase 2C